MKRRKRFEKRKGYKKRLRTARREKRLPAANC